MRGLKIIALGSALTLFLSGCMRMNMDLVVNADDTVSGSMIVAFDKKLLEQSGMTPEQVLQQQGLGTSTEVGVTTETYDQDGYLGSKISFANKPLAELGKTTGATSTGEELIIKRQGNQLITSGAIDMTSAAADESTGLTQALLDSFDIKVTITYPGEIVSSTGNIEGSTVTWHVPAGQKVTFDTVVNSPLGTRSSGSGSGLLLGGTAFVLAVLAAGIVFARRRQTDTGEAAPDSEA